MGLKVVLILLVVVALVWLLRRIGGNASAARPPPPAPSRPAAAQQIVACAHCGVHLPASEALPGRGGSFCDEAHRLAYEATHRGG